MKEYNYQSGTDLIPAIIQDVHTDRVLMLGYMNAEAVRITRETGKITFFSRSKNRLWVKGETSGNFLEFVEMKADCDRDALLIKARPTGPVCHLGHDTCWNEANQSGKLQFLHELEELIKSRKESPLESSYTARLLAEGINKISQKLGEEAVELIIEAKDDHKDLFLGEAADLIYHFLVLLQAKESSLEEVVEVLQTRHKR